MIAEHHLTMLAASGITAEFAMARGYETITDPSRLARLLTDQNGRDLGIVKAGRNVPGLLVPQLAVNGSTWGYQYRPDEPRLRDGKPVKYETIFGQRNGLDFPLGIAEMFGDPTVPKLIVEGSKKADAAAVRRLCAISVSGVWNWRGRNSRGGLVAVADWNDVALKGARVILAYDGDAARKESVHKAMRELANYLAIKGARVEYLWLPDTDEKTGLDDYLVDHSCDEMWRLVKPTAPPLTARPSNNAGRQPDPKPAPPPVRPVSLHDALAVFKEWLYLDDTAPVLAVAATIVANLVECNGHARVPFSYTVDGYWLGGWANTQRDFHAKGTLDAQREKRLEALPGWIWDTRVTQWEEGFSQLLHYVERHSHARVPKSYTVDGYRLGAWVGKQRRSHAEGTLEADRQRRLEAPPGWTWDPRADKWEHGFSRLLDYVERNGDARVPFSYTVDDYKLGGWVSQQRVEHKKGTLDADRKRRLQDLPGWTWKASSSTVR